MIVDCALYEDGVRRPGTMTIAECPATFPDKDSFVWIGLYEPTEDEFAEVRQQFALHELAVEDAIAAHQRPKLEPYDESVFIVLKTARYDDARETVDFGEIQVFLGEGYVVHVRHGEAASLSRVRRQLEERPDQLRAGPSSVLHAVVDHVVDDYEAVVRGLEQDISQVELQVFSDAAANPVKRIYLLKREVVETRAALGPLQAPLDDLARGRVAYVHDDLSEYFRDVHDHLTRLVDRVGTFDNLLSSILEANLTRVSVRQNEDMRKISAWVAIAAVPTMIAGIYGMNFEEMPELRHDLGYPGILALMTGVCLFMYWRFHKAGWLGRSRGND